MSITDELFKEGVEAYHNKEYQKAIESFSEVIKQEPNAWQAYYNRALSLYSADFLDEAKEDLLKLYHAQKVGSTSVFEILASIAKAQHNEKEQSFWNNELDKFNKAHEKREEQSGASKEIVEGKTTSRDSDGNIISIALFRPNITFNDVIGMEKIKKYLTRHVINPIRYPDLYKEYHKKIGGGVILFGCSGTGKTYLVRATADESAASMIVIKPSEILSQYVSIGESNVSRIWNFCRSHKPCILFLDEVDAIASRRNTTNDVRGEGSALKMLLNSILIEMSSVDANNDGISVVGATNRPWDIDPSLKRSGRFDDSVYINLPNLKERIQMFKYYLKEKPIEKINYRKLGLITSGYTGSDISRICDVALLEPLDHAIKTNTKRKLTTNDIVKTISRDLKESPATEWFTATRGEIWGHEQVEIVDKKVHKTFKSGVLEPGEMTIYRELIDDTKKHTSGFGKFKIGMERTMGYLLP